MMDIMVQRLASTKLSVLRSAACLQCPRVTISRNASQLERKGKYISRVPPFESVENWRKTSFCDALIVVEVPSAKHAETHYYSLGLLRQWNSQEMILAPVDSIHRRRYHGVRWLPFPHFPGGREQYKEISCLYISFNSSSLYPLNGYAHSKGRQLLYSQWQLSLLNQSF